MKRIDSRKRITAALILFSVLFIFGFFWAAAYGVIDISRLTDPCGFKQRYGLPCPTCGMTTSIIAFMKGRIFESFYLQPVAAIFCFGLVATAICSFSAAVFGVDFGLFSLTLGGLKVRYIILVLIIILMSGWAVTLARALVQRN